MPHTAVPSTDSGGMLVKDDPCITIRCRVMPRSLDIISFRSGDRTGNIIVNALVPRAERMILIDREVKRLVGGGVNRRSDGNGMVEHTEG